MCTLHSISGKLHIFSQYPNLNSFSFLILEKIVLTKIEQINHIARIVRCPNMPDILYLC